VSARRLKVSYVIWKALVQNNGWPHYHYADSEDTRDIYTGNRDMFVRSYADDDGFADWQTTFSSTSIEVAERDDAEAQIVGLTGLLAQPVDPDTGALITQLEHTQDDDVPLVAFSPRVGDEEIIATSNYADRCSWFFDSVRVTDETLTVDGTDPTLYESANQWWIDMLTGRVLNEEKWIEEAAHGYLAEIKDAGVVQTVRPFPDDPGSYDCEILWKEGKVKFLNGPPTGPVTASYNYESGSQFALGPDEGQVLKIESGEADFSVGDEDKDYRIIFTTEIDYDIWGFAWYYAPQYPSVRLHADSNVTLSGPQTIDGVAVATGDQVALFSQTDPTEDGMWIAVVEGPWQRSPGMPVGAHIAGYLYFPTEGTTYGRTGQIVANPYPNDVVGTNDIMVVTYFTKNERVKLQTDHYKRSLQIIMEAKGAHPVVRAVGASDAHLTALKNGDIDLDEFRRVSRGFASDVQPIPFPYETVRELESSKGHQLRVSTRNDLSFGGETVTLTFYCTSWPEV